MVCGEKQRLARKLEEANRAYSTAFKRSIAGDARLSLLDALRVARDDVRLEAWKHLLEHQCSEVLIEKVIESCGGKMYFGSQPWSLLAGAPVPPRAGSVRDSANLLTR
jgi:hypothetical protein